METKGDLIKSRKSLKSKVDDSVKTSTLETPIFTLGDDRIGINDNINDLFPETYKTL